MFYLVGITLSAFLGLLLFLKKDKQHADNVLLVWMVLIILHQLLFYLDHSGISAQYPHLLGLTLPLPLLHGVLLFLYVSTLTKEKAVTVRSAFPHLIPFLLLILLAIPFFALSAEEKLTVFEHQGKGFEWYGIIQLTLIVGLGLFYVGWSLSLIRKHRSHIQEVYSNIVQKNLKWLEYLSIGLGAIWVLVFFFDDVVIFSGVVLLVLFIGFFGINQVPIFYSVPKPIPENMNHKYIQEPQPHAKRYAKSGLSEVEAQALYAQLCRLMEQEALYKQSDLTLSKLADQLHIHSNYLSQVINQKEQKNFYTYINTLRVEEFIRAVSQPKNRQYTLLAIAYDCGFNSKSTFNKYFKKYTGTTPSDYFKT